MNRSLALIALALASTTATAQSRGDYALTVPAADATESFDFEIRAVSGGFWRTAGCIDIDLATQGVTRVRELHTTCELTNAGFIRTNEIRACILNSAAFVDQNATCVLSFAADGGEPQPDGLACITARSLTDDNPADNVAADCAVAPPPLPTTTSSRCDRSRYGVERCNTTHLDP